MGTYRSALVNDNQSLPLKQPLKRLPKNKILILILQMKQTQLLHLGVKAEKLPVKMSTKNLNLKRRAGESAWLKGKRKRKKERHKKLQKPRPNHNKQLPLQQLTYQLLQQLNQQQRVKLKEESCPLLNKKTQMVPRK